MTAWHKLVQDDCLKWLSEYPHDDIHLTFADPPFNQGKGYRHFNDSLPDDAYWDWFKEVLAQLYRVTTDGGGIYFMQREKNTEKVLRVLRESGWTFQNLIIWKKKTSAVPSEIRYAKQYQVIAFATKGKRPRVFNKLRADLPLLPGYKYERTNGVYLSDVWDDIRELTSGYFAGDEALRKSDGERAHIQQAPIALLLRIVLSSTLPGDTVLDPFAGTGTTLVASRQLLRNSIGVEIDPENVRLIEERMTYPRKADSILDQYSYYRHTPNLSDIWSGERPQLTEQGSLL